MRQKLSFFAILSRQTSILGPGAGIWVQDDGRQSDWLLYPQSVHIKPIKPMKTHLKTHKIGPKIGFFRHFKSPNPDFGPRRMDLGAG